MTRHSICIISEDLTQPLDEGIKRFAYSLVKHWAADASVLGLSVRSGDNENNSRVASLGANKIFLDYRLRAKLEEIKPDLICYVPSASATFFSFLRARILKLYQPRAKVAMVSLQPRYYSSIARRLLPFLAPDMVFVQDERAMERLLNLGCRAQLLPSGVNLEKFVPASSEKRQQLRAKYRLNPETFTVLHVGHLTKGRNIELLAEVRRRHNVQTVLVGSSLPHHDRFELTTTLRNQGIKVFDEYIPDIEEMYQLADCYIFPVFSEEACIGTPLSVLEAMACNLPVVSVRYGTLSSLFEEGDGLLFADTPEELVQNIARVKTLNGCRTREKVLPYSWENISKTLLQQTMISKEKHQCKTVYQP